MDRQRGVPGAARLGTGTFFPSFAGGNTAPAILVTSVVLWVVHFLVLRGCRKQLWST